MAQLLELSPGRFRLDGDLTLTEVAALARESRRLFPAEARKRAAATGPEVELDLSGVTQTSSAAVALVVDWQARARAAEGRLQLINWPEPMARIARFSNLGDLLGVPAPRDETAQSSDSAVL